MSTQVSGAGYGNNSYGKASMSYLALKDMLGDDLFKQCLHTYMDRWHGKHPMPWDYFYSFNDASKQNLNWFWNNWFFSNNYTDLAAGDLKKSAKGYEFTIKNVGGFAIPADVIISFKDGKQVKKHLSPAVWKDGRKVASITIAASGLISSIVIDNGIYLDATPGDNVYTK
jgi:hypothetical protein